MHWFVCSASNFNSREHNRLVRFDTHNAYYGRSTSGFNNGFAETGTTYLHGLPSHQTVEILLPVKRNQQKPYRDRHSPHMRSGLHHLSIRYSRRIEHGLSAGKVMVSSENGRPPVQGLLAIDYCTCFQMGKRNIHRLLGAASVILHVELDLSAVGF